MSFTYFHDKANPTERDYVRFIIRDVTKDKGPLPEDANFDDHEIDMFLAIEKTWQGAVAACYEALEAAWIPNPSYAADGYSVSMSHISANFGKAAKHWRRLYGGTAGSSGRAREVIRVDGYSQDVSSIEVS
jgi:hypothetical protein